MPRRDASTARSVLLRTTTSAIRSDSPAEVDILDLLFTAPWAWYMSQKVEATTTVTRCRSGPDPGGSFRRGVELKSGPPEGLRDSEHSISI